MKEITHNIHDRAFRSLARERDFALALLKTHLPTEISTQVDWRTLTVEHIDGRHIRADLKSETQSDILCSANVAGKPSFFYTHVEHQSTPDPLIALRILNYKTNFLLDYAKNNPGEKEKLPLLISLLYYHGTKTPYPYSLNWLDCFELPKMAAAYTTKPILIDVSQRDDQTIKSSSPEIAGTELIFKYIRTKDFTPYLSLILSTLQTAPSSIRQIALQYIMCAAQVQKDELLKAAEKYLSNENEDYDIMATPAQQWYDEGKLEGKLEGRLEGKLEGKKEGELKGKQDVGISMLAKGYAIEIVAEITQLPIKLLKKLQTELSAKDLLENPGK